MTVTKQETWPMSKTHTGALATSTAVLVLGVATSLAGNVQAIHLDNHRPGIGAIISAVFWPILLLLVVELLAHVPWLDTHGDRWTKVATLVVLGGVSAWISYWHLANVLSNYGYDVASRYAGPLAVDMAMVLASLALYRVVQARRGHVDKPLAKRKGLANLFQDTDMSNGQPAADWTRDMDMATSPFLDTGQLLANEPLSTPVDKPVDRYARLDNPLDTDVASAVQGVDMAMTEAGQELANETEGWLAGLQGRVQTEPTLPVPVSPSPRRPRASIPVGEAEPEARELLEQGKRLGEVAEILGERYGVSARTVRRQAWWTRLTDETIDRPDAS